MVLDRDVLHVLLGCDFMELDMKLSLPIPTSSNKLTANKKTGGRVSTKEYKAWKHAAGWELQTQARGQGFTGPVVISIALSEESNLDLGNCEKATTDLLVTHRVIPDDRKRYVRGISLIWQDEDDNIHVTIEPAAISNKANLKGQPLK